MASIYQKLNARKLEQLARIEARRVSRRNNPSLDLLRYGGKKRHPFHPAKIRREILNFLTTEWTHQSDLLDALREKDPMFDEAWRVFHVLKFLKNRFRIEEGKVYEWQGPPEKGRTTLEERVEKPPQGANRSKFGFGFAYRILPYDHKTLLTLIDRVSDRHTRDDHPSDLAMEFNMREDFVYEICHRTRYLDPEDPNRARNAILSLINRSPCKTEFKTL
jgi:hypothetical protein